jgi:hypothetical protein
MNRGCKWDEKTLSNPPKPYLIQRMTFKPDCKNKTATLSELMTMDYMGSAEFEFGALPKSLKRITKTITDRKIFEFTQLKDFRDMSLVILARTQEEADTYFEWIQLMCASEYSEGLRLKEYPKLWDHMPHEAPYRETDPILYNSKLERYRYGRESVDCWWDIQFDMFFCFGHKKLKRIVCSIQALRNKRLKDLEDPEISEADKEAIKEWI